MPRPFLGNGGPGAIRTPDPQIRSLTLGFESQGKISQPALNSAHSDQWVTKSVQTDADPENENPGALAGATGADLRSGRVADEDSLKRIEAARALAAVVSDCDPRDRVPLLKRLLDYHLGIGRGFFLGPGDWS